MLYVGSAYIAAYIEDKRHTWDIVSYRRQISASKNVDNVRELVD